MGCNAVCQDLDCPFLALHHIMPITERRIYLLDLFDDDGGCATCIPSYPFPYHLYCWVVWCWNGRVVFLGGDGSDGYYITQDVMEMEIG